MIEFPGLGLKFEISREAFSLFGISIYWYGIIIAAGFMAAVLLAMRDSKNFDIDQDSIIDLVLITVPAAIIGARLYYVVFSWSEFKDDLWSIFNTRRGGLAIYGGVLAAVTAAYIFTRVKKIPLWKLFDFAVVYIPLGQAIGRWGNFVNQEAFGTNTKLPWGMTGSGIRDQLTIMQSRGMNVDPALPVHPTFLYESLWNFLVFLTLIWFRKRKKVTGEVFFLYWILYGAGRLWIEGLRTDSLMLGNIRISQLLSLVLIIAFTAVVIVRRNKLMKAEDESVAVGDSKYANVLKALKEDEDSNHIDTGNNGTDMKTADDLTEDASDEPEKETAMPEQDSDKADE